VRSLPTWALGLAVALLGWRTGMYPPAPGLDSSWNAGLTIALKEGMQFGETIVFSYGPLGFLKAQGIWFSDLAVIAFLYAAAVYVAFCCALVWALRRLVPALLAALLAFLVIALLPLLEQSLLLAVIAAVALIEGERNERRLNLFILVAASFAAVEALSKLSIGPVIVAIFLLALLGAGARKLQVAAFLALLAAELLALWLLTGQSLGAIPTFLENTWQVVSGYSSAMLREVNVAPWKVTMATIAAAIVAVATAAASYFAASYPSQRARWATTAIFALTAFIVFKEGVVRTDAGHLTLFFSTACVLWLAVPWRRGSRWQWLWAVAVVIAAAGLPVRPPGTGTNLDAVANVKLAAEQVDSLFSPSRRHRLQEEGRGGMKGVYRLDPATLAALGQRTVVIEPWEVGVAWAYGLNWQPLPVFQNYSAYTKALDELNAAAVASPDGPERILRENQLAVFPEFDTPDLDGRYLGWDPPAQARAVFCNFTPLSTNERWQVLGRTPDRCGEPRLVRTTEAAPGETVAVPRPGPREVIFVRIDGAGVSGLERVTTTLLHAALRQITVNGDQRYRLVPETAGDGLMVRSGAQVADFGPFSATPQARTIAVSGAPGDLRYEFFAMPTKG
jgi:hypothetical protein